MSGRAAERALEPVLDADVGVRLSPATNDGVAPVAWHRPCLWGGLAHGPDANAPSL